MENMESKGIETYFDKAKSLPVAMNIAEVRQLIRAKGVTSLPKKSWWNLNNSIIMTTSIVLISVALFTLQSAEFNQEVKAYAPSSSSISFVQLNDSEKEDNHLLVSLKKTKESKLILPKAMEEQQDTSNSQHIGSLNLMTASLLAAGEEPLGPVEPIAPEQIEEPLESNLGGDFQGKSKTVTKLFDIGGIETLDISHKNGDVTIETWDQNKIEVSATFTVKTENTEHEILAMNDFDISLNPINTTAVIESTWDELNNCAITSNAITAPKKGIRKWLYFSSDGKNNKAETNGGEAFEYENFKIVYTIKIPKSLNVTVSNQYANVTVPDLDGNLAASLFRGKLIAKNVGGNLDVSVKYGNAVIGNYQEATLTIFRSDLELGNGSRLNLTSNYSEVKLFGTNELNVNAFRSNVIANSGIAKLEGSFKYGDLTLKGPVVDGDLDLFRSNLKGTTFDQLNLAASYSSLVADKALVLKLEEGFRTDFKVSEVGTLLGNIKYSPLKIETLSKEIDLSTFRGEFDVKLIQADFSSVNLKSKYTTVNLSFSAEAKYNLDAITTHTQFNFPDGIADLKNKNGAGSQVTHSVGTFNKGSQRKESAVNVESFQGFLKLN